MLARMVFLKSLEFALNQYLQADPDYRPKIQPLTGKYIHIELSGIKLNWLMSFTDSKIFLQTESMQKPDLSIQATPINLARLFCSEDSNDLIQSGKVKVDGDMLLAQQLQTIMKSLNFDWERYLALVTGDITTQKVKQAQQFACDKIITTKEQLFANAKEYLQEETDTLVSRNQANDFYHSVEEVRDDVERLQLRIKRLTQATEAEA